MQSVTNAPRSSLFSKANFAIVSFGALALLVSLSGRAPKIWSGVVQFGLGTGRAFEKAFAVDLGSTSDVPWAVDELGHLLFWGTGMVVLGLLTRKRIGSDVVAVVLFLASVLIEFLQGFSGQRSTSIGDAIANATGIMAGLAVVMLIVGFKRFATKASQLAAEL